MKGQDARKALTSVTTVKAKTAGFPAQGCIASLYYRGLNESYGDYRQGTYKGYWGSGFSD